MQEMQGKIIKGIAGFYYVHAKEGGIYECRARGLFRNQNKKPLVGDNVAFDVLDEAQRTGNIVKLMPRKNELIRPAVANVDQAVVIFALAKPAINLNLLDRFLISMERKGLPTVLCFHKTDIAPAPEQEELKKAYEGCGLKVLFTSILKQEGLCEICGLLKGKTSTVAGPSGVGKSSIINLLQDSIVMETGQISRKAERGRHTTRHTEIIPIDGDTYIMDTPGFSSLELLGIDAPDLRFYYHEFDRYEGACRFNGCTHTHEPDCAVKAALEGGLIGRARYENYLKLYQELTEKEKRRY